MSDFETLLDTYDYPLRKEDIALTPKEPRDSAQILIYNPTTNETTTSTFKNLVAFLPKNALLVFNNTKVIPARIYAKRTTGGVVEILCTELNLSANTCIAKANKKLREGEVLYVSNDTLTVLSTAGEYTFRAEKSLAVILKQSGTTPFRHT